MTRSLPHFSTTCPANGGVAPIIPPRRSNQRVRSCGLGALLLLAGLIWGGLGAFDSSSAFAQDVLSKRLDLLHQRYHDRHKTFQTAMEAVAQECERQSFFSDAERIRKRAAPAAAKNFDIDQLPTALQPEIPLTLPVEERSWRIKLQKLERDYAIDLYRIGRDALRLGHPTLTYQIVREVAFFDPDNISARTMLGFVQDKKEWTTPFKRRMALRGWVDDPRFGWMDAKLVTRYQNGERQFNGQWMSAEKEAALRSDFQNAWEIGTEHFVVRTNVGLEQGVELSRRLEVFHKFFLREFAAFFNSRQQIEKLLDTTPRPTWDPAKRYQVSYYRTKAEFVAALKPRMPEIEKANGLYLPRDRTAYFFETDETSDDPQERLETIYHEITHQILGESRKEIVDAGEISDFWIVEGFPCYLESYTETENGPQMGDPRHIRMFWARHTIIDEDTYLPMRKFTSIGRASFPLQAQAYNQAAAMSHFFLNYEDGIYRDGFIHFLSQIYHPGNVRKPPLEDILGVPYETLDLQFLEYLKTFPADPPPRVKIIQESADK